MRKVKLHWWILLGMGVGAFLGAVTHSMVPAETVEGTVAYQTFDGIAEIFLNLLKMIVVPLVFFSLVNGMQGMGSVARLGRLGVKTFSLYIVTSMLAIMLGLLLVNTIQPGVGMDIVIPTEPVERDLPSSVWEVLSNMVPQNVVEAAANFDLLGVIIFALFFGACLLAVPRETGATMSGFSPSPSRESSRR